MSDFRANDDAVLAEIAARQHGVVSVAQLRAAGFDKHAVHNRVRAGRLHRVHQRVYAVGHNGPSQRRRWMAAVLACGDGAALSHTSAAALWGLLRPFRGPIQVTSPSLNGRARRRGIALHRSASLATATVPQATHRDGIPVTTPRRTIADLRTIVTPDLVRRAIRQAEIRGLIDARRSDRTRSDLERDFLSLCRRHSIPPPEVNVRIGRWTVDFVWRGQRVAVETDFFGYHRGSVAFEDDHQRDLDLRAAGFAVRRYTDRQLDNAADDVVADLRRALGPDARPAAPGGRTRRS